ncbi:oligosaccharide flippase family protein, partial [Enterococcus faecium]|nr:oligosaccharide flippase family protein [Enterococcus faecium]
NFFSKIFTLITIFIFVKTSSDLNIYIFLNILGMFIGNISMIIQLKKFLFQPFNLVFLDYKSIKECFNLFIPQILSNSKNTFDRLILLTLTGNNSFVGLYDQGRKLINIIIAVSNSATTAVLPKMTSLKAQNETKKFEMIIHKVLPILVLFSVFATTGLIINADLFVSIFFGSSFTDVSQVLKYLSLSLLVIPLNFFLYNAILLPSSEDKIYRNILTINFFVVILLNLALDRKLDINGA